MAITKTIDIKIDSKQAIKSLEELGGTFEDVNGEGAVPLSTTIGELEDRLYAMAVAGDTASDEFKEISSQVGKMKKVIIETDLEIDGLSQTMSQNVGGALNGVASGFALAQGAMGAFGASGEAVEEALLKVQSAMAISQGLQGIRESVASFKALRKSIMATTVVQKALNFVMNLNPVSRIALAIGALGVAIAALWKPIKQLGQSMGLLNKETERNNDIKEKALEKVSDELSALDELQTALNDETKTREEKNAAVKALQAEYPNLLANVDAEKDGLKAVNAELKRAADLTMLKAESDVIAAEKAELYKQKLQARIKLEKGEVSENLYKQRVKFLEQEGKLLDKELDKRKEAINLINQEGAAQKALSDQRKKDAEDQEKADQKAEDARKKAQEDYKAFLVERRNAEKKIEDLRANAIKDEEERKLELARLAFERELETLEGTEEQKGEQRKLITERYEKEIRDLKLSYVNEDIELRGAQAQANKEALDKEMSSFVANEVAKTESKKEQKEKRTQLDKDEADARIEIAKQSFQLIAEVADLFAGRSEKAARIAFNINKAANIAQATMDGYRAVLSTYAQTPGGPVIKGIAAGLAGGFAAVQIANIAKTEFQGGGASDLGSVNAPSAGGVGGGANVANFNVVGNTGVNQLAETLGEQDKAPIKAFVVGSDVTTQQSLDRNKVETATL